MKNYFGRSKPFNTSDSDSESRKKMFNYSQVYLTNILSRRQVSMSEADSVLCYQDFTIEPRYDPRCDPLITVEFQAGA